MVLVKYRTIPREGLPIKKIEAAYIAGFFDGDGSVRLQLQPRENSKLGFRIRTIISFAQKTDHASELSWIRKVLNIGYIYARNDNMTELKIEGFDQVERILKVLEPYVLFKKRQVQLVLKALEVIKHKKGDILTIAKISDEISKINYVTVTKKYTASAVKKFLSEKT